MNTKLFLRNLPRVVLLRPVPISDVAGLGTCYVDHEWRVGAVPSSGSHVNLHNLRTDHSKDIEIAAIKNSDEDQRADVSGLLNLHRQIVLRERALVLERLPPPAPRPTHGEFMDDTIVRVLREHGQQTTELLILRTKAERSGPDSKEFFSALSRLTTRGILLAHEQLYYLSAENDIQRDERPSPDALAAERR